MGSQTSRAAPGEESCEIAGASSNTVSDLDAARVKAGVSRDLPKPQPSAQPSGSTLDAPSQQPASRVLWPTTSRLFTRAVRAELARANIPLANTATNPAVAEVFTRMASPSYVPS